VSIGVDATLSLDLSEALSGVDELESRLAEVTEGLTVSLDTSTAEADLSAISAAPVEVPVEADTSEAEAELSSIPTPEPVEVAVETPGLDEAQSNIAGLGGGLGQVNAAAGTLGSTMGGVLSGGIAALGAGLFQLAQEYGEAEGVAAIVSQVIANQGGDAFTTADDVGTLASRIQEYSGFSDEAIQTGATFILTLGNIRNEAGAGNDIFDRAIVLTADLARRMRTDVPAAASALGKALADPERGLSRLERQIGPLDDALRNNILNLAANGDTVGAQAAILDALEGKVAGVAAAYGETLPGQLDRTQEALGEAAEAAGSVFAPAIEESASAVEDLINAASEIGSDFADAFGFEGFELPGVEGLADDEQYQPFRDFLSDVNSFGDSGFAEDAIRGSLAFEELGDTTDDLAAATRGLANESDDAAEGLGSEAEAASELGDKVGSLAERLELLRGPQRSVAEGVLAVRDAQRDALQAFADIDGAYVAGTESGDQFLGTLQSLGSEIQAQTLRLLELPNGAARARAAQESLIPGLRSIAREAGLSRDETETLIRTFARVPERQITRFETPGAEDAERRTRNVTAAANAVPRNVRMLINAIGADGVIGDLQRISLEAQEAANAIGQISGSLAGGGQIRTAPANKVADRTAVDRSVEVAAPTYVFQIDARGSTNVTATEEAAERGVLAGARKIATDVRLS
jgi:hypothetical protein